MRLCSACLLGVKCRYDGSDALSKKVVKLAKREHLIPVCPEQLGGLPTPREPSERRGRKVITKSGNDVTEQFSKGAEETLKLAKLFGVKDAVFKQRSPACGCGQIYDGTFSGKIVKGDGVTTAMLRKNGVRIISDEDL